MPWFASFGDSDDSTQVRPRRCRPGCIGHGHESGRKRAGTTIGMVMPMGCPTRSATRTIMARDLIPAPSPIMTARRTIFAFRVPQPTTDRAAATPASDRVTDFDLESQALEVAGANVGFGPPSGNRTINALVAQLDRASDFDSEGREFESLRARQPHLYHPSSAIARRRKTSTQSY